MVMDCDLSVALAHVEAAYPDEGCGVILHHPGTGAFRVQPLQNVYDRYHARDPVRFPRTARTAYLINALDLLRVTEAAEAAGERIACVFHSHADVGAYFSAEDQVMAAPEGEPLLPGVVYLVIAVDQGRATAARQYVWEDGRWPETEIPLGVSRAPP